MPQAHQKSNLRHRCLDNADEAKENSGRCNRAAVSLKVCFGAANNYYEKLKINITLLQYNSDTIQRQIWVYYKHWLHLSFKGHFHKYLMKLFTPCPQLFLRWHYHCSIALFKSQYLVVISLSAIIKSIFKNPLVQGVWTINII